MNGKCGVAVFLCFLSLLPCISANYYYVKANMNDSCPESDDIYFCRTLQDYADQPPDDTSNITLLFLNGTHPLSSSFYMQDLDSLTLNYLMSKDLEMSILCSHKGKLEFKNINSISIKT